MKEAFIKWEPKSHTNKVLLVRGIEIIGEYAAQGYRLTLRQLYYQLVVRDIIPNSSAWYKRLGEVVSNGRLAGYIDWDAIVDRGRVPVMPPDWSSPKAILESAARSFRLDRWEGQQNHVEVWCEKDALSSVIEPVCDRYHVRFRPIGATPRVRPCTIPLGVSVTPPTGGSGRWWSTWGTMTPRAWT